MSILNKSALISVGAFQICVQVVAIEDGFVESDEEFTIFVEPTNPMDIIGTNTSLVTIIDNDGEDLLVDMHLYINNFATWVFILGTYVRFASYMINVTEEDEFQVCVELFNNSDVLQRTVPIKLSFEASGGKAQFLTSLKSTSLFPADIVEVPEVELLYEFIPGGITVHCFNLIAAGDELVESRIEYHKVWLQTMNLLDKVDINMTTIIITDNDGKTSVVICT